MHQDTCSRPRLGAAMIACSVLAACAGQPAAPIPPGGLSVAGSAMLAGLGDQTVQEALGPRDRALAAEATFEALTYRADGTSVSWHNQESGHFGSVTPLTTYRVDGRACRDYRHTLALGARTLTVAGTGCRFADGVWRPA